MKHRFQIGTLVLGLGLISCFAFAQSNPNRAAVVNGETITLEELQKEAAPDLEKLDAQRVQFELNHQREKAAAMENALNELVVQRVLAAEAKKKGTTVDGLVQSEVDSRVPA